MGGDLELRKKRRLAEGERGRDGSGGRSHFKAGEDDAVL